MRIEKCPFCGKEVAETSNCKELEGCGHIEGCPATGPYVCVVCSMFEGGCGASSGYYDSAEKAIAAWNRRTQPEITGNTSDGYHTFNELYHHRAMLFSVICNDRLDRAWKSSFTMTAPCMTVCLS